LLNSSRGEKKVSKDGQRRMKKWRIIGAYTKREVKLRRADEGEPRLKTKKAEKEKEDK
jgi:hypothetical protein